jgi:hypothetical protein
MRHISGSSFTSKDKLCLTTTLQPNQMRSTRLLKRPIAMNLGYQLPKEVTQKIFENLSRSSVEKYIAGLPKQQGVLQDRISGDLLDPQTQWHTHHAGRNGEIGRWRSMLSRVQLTEITDRLGDFGWFEITTTST